MYYIYIDSPLTEEINFQNYVQHDSEFNCPCTFVRFTFASPVHYSYPLLIKPLKLFFSKQCENESLCVCDISMKSSVALNSSTACIVVYCPYSTANENNVFSIELSKTRLIYHS